MRVPIDVTPAQKWIDVGILGIEPAGENEPEGKDKIEPEGSVPTPLPAPKPLKNLTPQGSPNLRADGNPGNKGGGRPAERIRRLASETLDDLVAQAQKLAKQAGKQAQSAYDEGRLNAASTAHRDHTRAMATLADIGIGKQVTTVLEREEWLTMLESGLSLYVASPDERVSLLKWLKEQMG